PQPRWLFQSGPFTRGEGGSTDTVPNVNNAEFEEDSLEEGTFQNVESFYFDVVDVLSVSLKHICNPTTSLNTLLYHSGVSYKSSCASRLGFTEYSHRGVFLLVFFIHTTMFVGRTTLILISSLTVCSLV
ncbi:hypothetical protein HHX47_DHR10000225, partial [Lentinula edodes]